MVAPAPDRKADRLAAYNGHLLALWSATADLFVWHAETAPGTPAEKSIQVWHQVIGIVGALEVA